MGKISVKDLPKNIGEGNYAVDVPLFDLPNLIERYIKEDGLVLDPDFQRGHVWSLEQETAYIEFVLKGGKTALDFYLNHPGWMGSFEGEFVVVDGLQRITAIRNFFADKVPVFGGYVASDIDGLKRTMNYYVRVHVNTLQNRNDVIRWYIQFNASGTPHSKEEIERVKALIKE